MNDALFTELSCPLGAGGTLIHCVGSQGLQVGPEAGRGNVFLGPQKVQSSFAGRKKTDLGSPWTTDELGWENLHTEKTASQAARQTFVSIFPGGERMFVLKKKLWQIFDFKI